MKVSREELAARAEQRRVQNDRLRVSSRTLELSALLAGSLVIAAGLWLVYSAKTKRYADAEASTLNLNHLTGPQQITPLLGMIASPADAEFIANRIYNLRRHGVRFGNTGAIAAMRVTEEDISHVRGPSDFLRRIVQARQQRAERDETREASRGWVARTLERFRGGAEPRELSIPLLTAQQFAQLKPNLRVRDFNEYRSRLFTWTIVFFGAFYFVHVLWRFHAFSGDQVLMPAIYVLCGIGLILMLSLRDPLRDTLMFADFAQGVAAGCAAMWIFSLPDYQRGFSRLSYVPLVASLLLAIALGVFGTGPGTSDAKVNLFFFQPVELIRILIVFFLAGYFAHNWDALRQLRHKGGRVARWSETFNIPRLDYALPVAAGVAASLILFFWLNDLGPALVIGCLFLTMYSVARNRVLLAAVGLLVIILGFAAGYAVGYPPTITQRVEMWRSPWDNHVRGGDQVADSLWSLSTGGVTGTGFGLGGPETVPAAHTDLIISAFGEQAGFLGVAALFLLYSVLIYRSLRIALDASGTYSFFLVIGLALILALQILLITGGMLGLIPLSGVVSPFLSYGRTSMVANFILFAIILSVSSRARTRNHELNFGTATRACLIVLASLAVIVLARLAWVQAVKADAILVRGSLVMQADGERRYQYNPRLLEVARELPKGTIYDRNGIPLATSDRALIYQHHADYDTLGVNLDLTVSKTDRRQYPFGAPLFYLLGDVRSRAKQGATNTAFQEKASRIRLQGYDDVAEVEESHDPKTGQIIARVRRDYRALIPLLRHHWEPDNPAVKQILQRPRNVRMSIDARLQMRVSTILRNELVKLGNLKGAVVVIEPTNGDLLAAVSYPWPSEPQFASLSTNPAAPLPDNDLLDRARFGLYPPGSSFKIVTAIAALRKDPALARLHYDCVRLPDGRIGNFVRKRAIRDDVRDTVPHGSVDLQKGIVVSCNAFFAQFGTNSVGADMLYDTATRLGISVAQPDTPEKLRQFLPQASYGQGQVVASPFQMARVAATIANGGKALEGRWIIDETNQRVRAPQPLLSVSLADQLGGYMRGVVTSGTGRVLNDSQVAIAGKTGTAELAKAPSHAWFIGFAPYGKNATKQIAFAVLVENGQYGGTAAAPIAGKIVAAAKELGLL